MTNITELNNAIGAHGMWKTHLKTAIETGKIDMPVQTIRQDNQCAFGKWLHGPTVTAAEKASDQYKTVLTLHAEFHKTAALVAELALSGKKSEAEALIAFAGEFTMISAKLIHAMMEWKKTLK